ncbi:MAG: DUF4397 domain-containing protein [Peptococcaceae bacterium]
MSSRIRFIHGCSDSQHLDIHVKDCKLCNSFAYPDYTDYYDVDHGTLIFKICPTKKYHSLFDAYTYAIENSYQTAILSGKGTDLSFYVVADAYLPISYNTAYIRFANLAYNSPNLDFTLIDTGIILFRDVQYKEVTDYYGVNPDTYNIRVTKTGTTQTMITIHNVNMLPNRFYTIYVLGFTRDGASPQYLVFTDGK